MTEHNSKFYLLAGFLAAAGLAILIYLGLSSASLKVYSVGELLALEATNTTVSEEELVQIYGRVGKMENGAPYVILQDWADPSQTIAIDHAGVTLSGLKSGKDVFVTGTYKPEENSFTAEEIITTCPAKYETRRPEQQTPEIGNDL